MSYTDVVDDTPAPAPPAAPAPALQDYQEAFPNPVARDIARDQATILNDYFQRRDIADASARAGEAFVNNLDSFKSGLTDFVKNDPHAVHAAFDLADVTVAGLARTMPGIESPEDHAAVLTADMQHEIAAAAVTSAAELHEGLARGMLADDRISRVLGDSAGPLDTYISLQAQAREADHQAQVERLAQDQVRIADRSMKNYAGALLDPATGGVQFPDGWNQGVMADPHLPPAAKVAMAGVYERLRTNGDVPQSDPNLVTNLVGGIASGAVPATAQVLGQAGQGLKLADAVMLTNIPPEGAALLRGALEQGRAALATPENGQAGQEAFARFTNWLLPAARAGAVLDPASPDYVLPAPRLNGFAPTAADMVNVAYRRPMAERDKLSEIFSNPEYHKQKAERTPGPLSAPAGYQFDGSGSLVPTPVPSHPNTAPFYGVQPVSNDQAINPAGVDRDATGKLLTEVRTDAGIKALGASDLAQSTSGPRPVAAPALTEDQQRAFQEGQGLPPRAARAPAPRGRPPPAAPPPRRRR